MESYATSLTPRNVTAAGSIGIPSGVPAAEQLSLQQEAAQLLNQIDRAHNTLDALFSVGQSPTPSTSDIPTLAASIHMARQRMSELCNRLEDLQRAVGQI